MLIAVLSSSLSLSAPAAWADPCGKRTTPASGQYRHVVWIVMENHAYGEIVGSSAAPFENQLANECGLATNYSAVSQPSLPNYFAATTGSTQGISDDNGPSSHALSVPSLFSQLPGASRSLVQSMPSSCATSDAGEYVVRHNPEAYLTNLGTDCANFDVPLGPTPDLSADFTLVVPNLIDDMHDGTIQQGDVWLRGFFQAVFQTSQWQAGNTAVFLTFDEGSGPDDNVYTAVIAPTVSPGTRSAAAFDHYSLLRTAEDLLGLWPIGHAATATGMESAFNLGAGAALRPGSRNPSPHGRPAHPHGAALAATRALISAALVRQLAPFGWAARIGTLLKRGSFTFLFRAPRAGRLAIKWYHVPGGATSATRPVLIAGGIARIFKAAVTRITITLTVRGRSMLSGARRLKLDAEGRYTSAAGVTAVATKPFTLRR